jgi:hypothetical protein
MMRRNPLCVLFVRSHGGLQQGLLEQIKQMENKIIQRDSQLEVDAHASRQGAFLPHQRYARSSTQPDDARCLFITCSQQEARDLESAPGKAVVERGKSIKAQQEAMARDHGAKLAALEQRVRYHDLL